MDVPHRPSQLRTDHLAGAGSASPGNGQEKVSVDLDLRSARAGAYFLSTKQQDQAAYYYPLQIKELRSPSSAGKPHSYLRATIGSTCMARRAGT
jgi:hypothetical protein